MRGFRVPISFFLLYIMTAPIYAQLGYWAEDQKIDSDYKHASAESYENWRDRKFGMRIHWGVYSVLGLDASWPTVGASDEFKTIYNTLYQVFNPTEFDPEEWVDLAEQGGMKYFVFTAKHCDGFCMFDTKSSTWSISREPEGRQPGIGYYQKLESDYDIFDTPYKQDIVGELVKTFRKRGLGIGIYYSNQDWFDWNQRFNDNHMYHDSTYTLESDPEGYRQAIQRQTLQLREISTKYGKLDLISFDTGLPRSLWPETVKMIKMVRSYQPDALFRNRGLGPYGDHETPEHWIPEDGNDPRLIKPWQAIEQLGTRWAYQPNDTYKPKEWILETLIDCTAKGGNFMVGVSPMANGKFPQETVDRLLWAGRWLKVNGEAIYKTRPWKHWKEGDNIWFTQSKNGKWVYAISKGWPGNNFTTEVVKPVKNGAVYLLGNKGKLSWKRKGKTLTIEIADKVSQNKPSEFAYVFKIQVLPDSPENISSDRSVELGLRGRDEEGHPYIDWKMLDPKKTAIVVVDIWEQGIHGKFEENGRYFGCYSAYQYQELVSKAVNQTLKAVRNLGMQVVFAPANQTHHYEDQSVRKLVKSIPQYKTPWKDVLQSNNDSFKIPFSDYHNNKGCYCHRDSVDFGVIPMSCPRHPGSVSVGQNPNLEIFSNDLMIETAEELWNIIQHHNIETLIYMGGATSMCLPGRPFGLLNMKKYGMNCILDRCPDHIIHRVPDGWNGDTEDPKFGIEYDKKNHWDRIVEYYEQYICPTIDGTLFQEMAEKLNK